MSGGFAAARFGAIPAVALRIFTGNMFYLESVFAQLLIWLMTKTCWMKYQCFPFGLPPDSGLIHSVSQAVLPGWGAWVEVGGIAQSAPKRFC